MIINITRIKLILNYWPALSLTSLSFPMKTSMKYYASEADRTVIINRQMFLGELLE